MAKSIKLKNDTYIDSSGIAHKQTNLKTILNNINSKSKNIWSGTEYTIGNTITLSEKLEVGKMYCIEIMGISGTFKHQYIFIFNSLQIQFSYWDMGSNSGVRYRLNVSSDYKTLTLDDNTMGNTTNSAIKNIFKIVNYE